MELKDVLIDIVNKSPMGYVKVLSSKKYETLIKDINSISYIKPESLREKIYWIINGLKSYPKCVVCGKEVTSFQNLQKGYIKHCSCSCAQLDNETRMKLEKSCLEKYGTKNPAQAKSVQDKMKQTCLERYGVENAFASEEKKQKIRATNLERYGVDNPRKSEEVKKKQKETLLKRYGITCGYHHCGDYHRSKGEIEVYKFVKELFADARCTDRKAISPMELDIFIPSINVGIEYDGDYWHSFPEMIERDKKKNELCLSRGIRLFRIKETDWTKEPDVVKEQLRRFING